MNIISIRNSTFSSLFYFVFLLLWSFNSYSEELYFIDAHSQADEAISLENILALMKEAGVKKTILSARRKRKSFDIADFAEVHPEEIIAAVRTKSGHYIRNTDNYYKKLKKQIDSDRFNAMAELLLYHAKKGDLADEVVVFPSDQRVTVALQGAKNNGWPLILHIEFAAMTSGQKHRYFDELDKLLLQNPKLPVALIHMGQLNASEVKHLIDKYPNIYFLTSHSNNVAIARSNQPWVNMFKGDTLAPEWVSVIVANPGRFVFAIDNVWPTQWHNGYKEQVQLWRTALAKLPSSVAIAIAHENAERLWEIR